ncbi:MAG: toxin-antitoxin system HicB family antitoxin [Chitinophagales bacterium]
MTANKKRSTYRITPELDRIITQQAERLGISKNAYLQITLTEALENVNDQQRIINRIPREIDRRNL